MNKYKETVSVVIWICRVLMAAQIILSVTEVTGLTDLPWFIALLPLMIFAVVYAVAVLWIAIKERMEDAKKRRNERE